eukprot:TRINITY_DN7332_c0_g1_i1.p1 TRINITY_DN7332_c0_g1~~TRINITY_DN7332_c0_g1_i1.p1  ORF type:complete len:311 (-),score=68.00 TRINITY_DN7332_c0_g1_i1:70-915(-)
MRIIVNEPPKTPPSDQNRNATNEIQSKIDPAQFWSQKPAGVAGNGKMETNLDDFFARELKEKKGLVIRQMASDGNCLFRAISDQIYGDPEMHDQVRERCMDYMTAERDHFSQFIVEDFEDYIARKRKNKTFGNNTEIQAIGEMYNRPVEIYTCDVNGIRVDPINLFHGEYKTENAPLRLSYHHGNHYNSVIDPHAPTIGVGLGLPQLQPGLADKMLINSAIHDSENIQIESQLLEESKKYSDMEMAQNDIEEAILLQSQLELEEQIIRQSRQEYYQQMFKN